MNFTMIVGSHFYCFLGAQHLTKTLRVMKMAAMFLIMGCLHVSATGIAQERITFSGKDLSLRQAFAIIEKRTSYSVFFSEENLQNTKKITVNIKNATIEEVLKICLKGQPLDFTIKERTIFIVDKPSSSKEEIKGIGQPVLIDVKGRVVNEAGQPVLGVTVTIKGTDITTTTDENGEFMLRSISSDAVLVFSHVTMDTFEQKVSTRTEILVRLKTKIRELAGVEVIVSTGYEEIQKERATGSFVQIDNKLINRKVSTNILDRITEITSGLNYDPRNNIVSRSAVTIRGISTINANQRPLVVIDGFPYTENRSDGQLLNVNPNDVESITVLKDAAAAAIWGARAGNGVIVVVTKKGKFNSKPKVQLTANANIYEKPKLGYISTMSSKDMIEFEKKLFKTGYYNDFDDIYPILDYYPALPSAVEILLAKRRGQIDDLETENLLDSLSQNDIRKDIKKYVLRSRIDQQYAVNISGGNSWMNYYGSVGYDKNNSEVRRSDYRRFTLRLDNTFKITPKINLNTYIVYTQTSSNNNGPAISSIVPNGNSYPPISPYSRLVDNKGAPTKLPNFYRTSYVDTLNSPFLLDWSYSLLDEMNFGHNINQLSNTRWGSSLAYSILPELSIEIKYQIEKGFSNTEVLNDQRTFFTRNLVNKFASIAGDQVYYPVPLGSILDFTSQDLTSKNLRAQINFYKRWNKHQFSLVSGLESNESEVNYRATRRYGFNENTSTFNTLINYDTYYPIRAFFGGAEKVPTIDQMSGTLNRLMSYYMNSSYGLMDKYFLTLSGRQDGANMFGVNANDKWKPLWSIGTSWIISEEKHFRISWIDYLKARASYGFNGNIKGDATSRATIYYTGYNSLTGAQSAQVSTAPNKSLKWERVKIINAGLDFRLNKSRLIGSFEYYWKQGLDLISSIKVDPTSGMLDYTANNASVFGHGFDFNFQSLNLDRKLKWQTVFLLSYNIDKVRSYSLPATATQMLSGPGAPIVGKPLYSIYGTKWGGLDPSTGDPLGIIHGSASDDYTTLLYSASPTDLVYIGPANPQYFGSIRNSFLWNRLALSFNITFKWKYFFRKGSINYSNLANAWGGHGDYSKRWQQPGDEKITSIPSESLQYNFSRDAFYSSSEALVRKGDHIRFQDVRLSYDFKLNQFANFQGNGSIFIYINNIGLLWTKNAEKIDPDYGDMQIPTPRSFALGINFSF